ncbi:hypothetical protein ADK90_23890 [Streptomyces sp. XY413]|uniref:hypothetical protein n=1 Tax=Streptomyces sp. XY413 TaxID=1519479 RepID=UPI0006AE7C86|nr:hypothetical protein [Streptomyces sp. XY413]KOV17610.1 hypothetical protein ADK90_23890 [Streptomyces sp. XY413]
MSGDAIRNGGGAHAGTLEALLASTHRDVGRAVHDRLAAQGGVPELRDPDAALARMLWSAHQAVGTAVVERLSRGTTEADDEQHPPSAARFPPHGPLAGRLASVRLKYRREALRLARIYWPGDLIMVIRAALSTVESLTHMLEAGELQPEVSRFTTKLEQQLAQIDLPAPQERRRPDQTGADYLTEVELLLESQSAPLQHDLHNARHLLAGELATLLHAAVFEADFLLGADTVAQDLVDDLEQAHGKAQALRVAVATVERASSDFVGEDLSQANLHHVPLKGVRWDATTLWPEEWEGLIRRASMPASGEEGVLIIATEPHRSAVSADV